MKLKLDRPLAFFDIESTGINRQTDRIIDLAIVKLLPDGTREEKTYRVNPEMPIPSESTAVHGITDDDVKDAPTFQQVGHDVVAFLEDCDLAGYNIIRFDIPLLIEEFQRTGVPFDVEHRRVVDAQRIYHQKEPRDLTAALSFYCNEMHLDAHGAMGDVDATIRVLEGQLDRYDDVPRSIEDLSEFCNPKDPSLVDRQGKLKWNAEGEAVINFGKHQGRKLRDLAQLEKSFLKWMLKSDFPHDTRKIVKEALAGRFPQKESGQ